MFSFKEAGYCTAGSPTQPYERQDNREGVYQTVRVASFDYTQVCEQAASDLGATEGAKLQTTHDPRKETLNHLPELLH